MTDEHVTDLDARGPYGPNRVAFVIKATVNQQTFDFEGPSLGAEALSLFQSWVQAVGPMTEAQAAIDEAARRLKASTDGLADDVAANTPTTA